MIIYYTITSGILIDRSPCVNWREILKDKCPICCDTVVTLAITALNFENEEYNSNYTASFQNLEKSVFVNNRPIMKSGKGHCIWWHESRNWWIGPCENVGQNTGYAFLETDLKCPSTSNNVWTPNFGIWKEAATNEVLNGVTISIT